MKACDGAKEGPAVGFIDCDSHILENDRTWDYLDPAEREYRPRVLEQLVPGPLKRGLPPRQFWIVADSWAAKLPANSIARGNANVFSGDATYMTDPAIRLADLDALGIDLQLLISTFFIGVEIDLPIMEAALARSYNRWAADVCSETRGRLRWTLRAPFRMLDRAREELAFGKEHGAAGVHFRGVEQGYFLDNPYFYPLYEQAQDLDLVIVVHIGESVRRVENQPLGVVIESP